MTRRYDGKVRFVAEDFGDSELAERFGVRRYPAIFVNEVLVAKPKDFGFFGKGGAQGEGRYTPWRTVESHERFSADLTRFIDLAAGGEDDELRSHHGLPAGTDELEALPDFALTDLFGNELTRADLRDRVVVVEFWASWCPPCRGTLDWLGGLRERHGDRVAVVALAVESDEYDVRALLGSLHPDVHWTMGTPELAVTFGDVVSVPTLFVFDRTGATAAVFYGVPPDLDERATSVVANLLH